MTATDDFGGLLGVVAVKLDEREFCRVVRTTLAHQLITGVDGELLADLFSICRDDLGLFGFKDKAKTSEFKRISQNRKKLLDKLRSLTNQLQDAIGMARPDILVELDNRRLRASIRKLVDVVEDTAVRWWAFQSMAKTARRQPYPGTLSLSLNDFLCVHHRRWNQQQRDMIISACLQACRVYPRKDKIAEIASRVPMQRSREDRTTARDEGRVVHQPRGAKRRPSRGTRGSGGR